MKRVVFFYYSWKELLTTVPSIRLSKGPPKQVCRKRGDVTEGCEHQWGGAVLGRMWIGSSAWHCPRIGMERGFLGCSRTEGLCAWHRVSSLHCLLSWFMSRFTPSCRQVACSPSSHFAAPPSVSSHESSRPSYSTAAVAPQLSFPTPDFTSCFSALWCDGAPTGHHRSPKGSSHPMATSHLLPREAWAEPSPVRDGTATV